MKIPLWDRISDPMSEGIFSPAGRPLYCGRSYRSTEAFKWAALHIRPTERENSGAVGGVCPLGLGDDAALSAGFFLNLLIVGLCSHQRTGRPLVNKLKRSVAKCGGVARPRLP